jgi:hypothetical protein
MFLKNTTELNSVYKIKKCLQKAAERNETHFVCNTFVHCGPGSSVGIAMGYRLDGPGIESRWGRDVSHKSRPALGPTQPFVQWVPALSEG